MGVGDDDRLREQRDTAWDALREIEVIVRSESEDWSKLDGIGAIISNGPLDTAPGGPREDECARLRGEVERLRTRERKLEDALRAISTAMPPYTLSTDTVAVMQRRATADIAEIAQVAQNALTSSSSVVFGEQEGDAP